jgi:glycosyltransferase involved in cell wall biosynthesis
MKTMHILNSWAETSGGIATFYRALMEAASERRQRMSLIVPSDTDRDEDHGDFVRIYRVAAPKARFNANYRTIYPNHYLWRGGRVRRILNQESPDLVEISDKYTLSYLGALLRLRLMNDVCFRPAVVGISFERMDVNVQSYLSAGALGRAFSVWYMRHLYFPFFDHHIAISDQTAQELHHVSKGHVVERGVFRLPLGVDCRMFSPRHRSALGRSSLLTRVGASGKAILLLYVGRLVPEKNLSLLIETVEQLGFRDPTYYLLLAGDGISRDSFLAEAKRRLGARVSWLGHINKREELAQLYANCDFFLHPNPHEPFGIAPLEAMASGVLLIAPNAGGVKTYANSSNAGLVDATGQAFASEIQSMVNNEDRRQRMVQAAWQTAQEFSLQKAADRYLDLYKTIWRVSSKEMALNDAMPDDIKKLLAENLDLEPEDAYSLRPPLGISDLIQLYGLDRPDLKDPHFVPSVSPLLDGADGDIFDAIQNQNILLHHPCESFSPVTNFLLAAARDPNVLAIKQTLYRVGRNSPVVQALLEAVRRGKQVAVLVELNARFDEESNIEWAKALESEGVYVVYGLLGFKTHSKTALVVRQEGDSIRRYLHLATGNYNPATANTYTDLGLFTCDEDMGADATDLFNYLTGYSAKKDYRKFLVAPINLRTGIESLIRREIELQKQGQSARLIFKVNSLVDKSIIRLLYDASQAGVRIDLIVRGMCCLRPGVPGLSDNIRVISIVGRFLEHSRIYYFHNGGQEQIYLGSADLMPRNLDRRVEVLFPVEDSQLIRHLVQKVLGVYLADNVKARQMQADGSFVRVAPREGEKLMDSQALLIGRKSVA